MPDHIQYLIYPPSFLKDFSVATPKPAIENNSFNSFINIFLFYYSLFSNRNSYIFFYSKRAQYANTILYLSAAEMRLITIKTQSIASLQFENIEYDYIIIGKKEEEATERWSYRFLFRLPFKKKGGNRQR